MSMTSSGNPAFNNSGDGTKIDNIYDEDEDEEDEEEMSIKIGYASKSEDQKEGGKHNDRFIIKANNQQGSNNKQNKFAELDDGSKMQNIERKNIEASLITNRNNFEEFSKNEILNNKTEKNFSFYDNKSYLNNNCEEAVNLSLNKNQSLDKVDSNYTNENAGLLASQSSLSNQKSSLNSLNKTTPQTTRSHKRKSSLPLKCPSVYGENNNINDCEENIFNNNSYKINETTHSEIATNDSFKNTENNMNSLGRKDSRKARTSNFRVNYAESSFNLEDDISNYEDTKVKKSRPCKNINAISGFGGKQNFDNSYKESIKMKNDSNENTDKTKKSLSEVNKYVNDCSKDNFLVKSEDLPYSLENSITDTVKRLMNKNQGKKIVNKNDSFINNIDKTKSSIKKTRKNSERKSSHKKLCYGSDASNEEYSSSEEHFFSYFGLVRKKNNSVTEQFEEKLLAYTKVGDEDDTGNSEDECSLLIDENEILNLTTNKVDISKRDASTSFNKTLFDKSDGVNCIIKDSNMNNNLLKTLNLGNNRFINTLLKNSSKNTFFTNENEQTVSSTFLSIKQNSLTKDNKCNTFGMNSETHVSSSSLKTPEKYVKTTSSKTKEPISSNCFTTNPSYESPRTHTHFQSYSTDSISDNYDDAVTSPASDHTSNNSNDNYHLRNRSNYKCTINGCNKAFSSRKSRNRHSQNYNLHKKCFV